jgi:alkylhydroperoxidase family enzyme
MVPPMRLEEVLDGTDVLTHLDDAQAAAWRATDPELLELCRLRMAMLLDHRPTLAATPVERRDQVAAWPRSDAFAPVERACLAFTEQYTIDVASVTDDLVVAVRGHLGDEGLANFVNALLVVEQRMRLELVWDHVL